MPASYATEPFTEPPSKPVVQIDSPVSASRASTVPRFVPTTTQPPATTGVPVMSPVPPTVAVSTVHTGASDPTVDVVIALPDVCVRLFLRSAPYERQSPAPCAGASQAGVACAACGTRHDAATITA